MSNTTVTVTHPKLYLAVNGKLTHIKSGTEVTMSEEQAKALKEKVSIKQAPKKVDVTKKDK